MVCFIPVQYKSYRYPAGIKPRLQEVAGHFGKEIVHSTLPLSLHTEYSAGKRSYSALARQFPALQKSQQHGVPLLWTSSDWASAFAGFIHSLCQGEPPAVLEIHPPYWHTCDVDSFFQRFAVFEETFRQWAPQTQIVLENRCGNLLRRRFLLSTYQDLLQFAHRMESTHSSLRIALDLPQLFTAHRLQEAGRQEKIAPLLNHLKEIRHCISSIHLWGNHNGTHAHWGNLDTYFSGDQALKQTFLQALFSCLDDNVPRYLVPEVNSGQTDFSAIVQDLLAYGFSFL